MMYGATLQLEHIPLCLEASPITTTPIQAAELLVTRLMGTEARKAAETANALDGDPIADESTHHACSQ